MSDQYRYGEFELPPELSDLENSLRKLPLPSQSSDSSVDRDELMFQSGWAAALAAEGKAPAARSTARWGWPALAGSFATLSAALAIALFTPAANNDSPVANKPAAEKSPLAVDTLPKSHDGGPEPLVSVPDDADNESDDKKFAPSAFYSLANRIFPLKPAATSAIVIRNRSLRLLEIDEVIRPRTLSISTRPQAAPLRINSHRNQQLWEQL